MAKHIAAGNISMAWRGLIAEILEHGARVTPRGAATKEILNVTIEISNGLNNIIFSEARDMNYRFMIAEWLWIQAGLNDVESLARYNSVMRTFSDDGKILKGAYGPRLHPQWDYIVNTLKSSPSSRQAVSTIWAPSPESSKDIPCTISLQWMIRDGLLHCTINMRSSDVWLGLPYDFFSFSQLTNGLSARVGVPVGSVTMNLASSHLYLKNEEKALMVMSEGRAQYLRSPQLTGELPTPEQTKSILAVHPGYMASTIEEQPWEEYEAALAFTKAKALEILSIMSQKEIERYVREAK